MKPRYFTIPNLLTLSNLFCGSLAVLSAFGGNLERSFWLIVLAAVFDFCDGFAARLLKQYSPLGEELDSLADIVSFGLAPSAVVYAIYCTAVCEPAGLPLADAAGTGVGAWRYVAFIIVLLSALRLARFNVDTEQTSEFIGMPTPACAIFFASTGYLFARGMFTGFDMRLILIVAVVMALFLILPIRMFSFKFHSFGWRGNELRYSFVILSAAAIALWQIAAVPCIIIAYMLVSIVRHTVLMVRK